MSIVASFFGIVNKLAQQYVGNEHYAEAHQQRIGCATFTAVGVSLGDHFVADDIEHGAAGKCQGKRQDGRSNADSKITDKCADYFDKTGKTYWAGEFEETTEV